MSLLRMRKTPNQPQMPAEFLHKLEREITAPPPLEAQHFAPPAQRPRTISDKIADLQQMEERYDEGVALLRQLADAKARLRTEIMEDLAADKVRTAARLEQIDKLTEHYNKGPNGTVKDQENTDAGSEDHGDDRDDDHDRLAGDTDHEAG